LKKMGHLRGGYDEKGTESFLADTQEKEKVGENHSVFHGAATSRGKKKEEGGKNKGDSRAYRAEGKNVKNNCCPLLRDKTGEEGIIKVKKNEEALLNRMGERRVGGRSMIQKKPALKKSEHLNVINFALF